MLEIQLCKKTSNLILKILNDTKQNKIEISRKKQTNKQNKTKQAMPYPSITYFMSVITPPAKNAQFNNTTYVLQYPTLRCFRYLHLNNLRVLQFLISFGIEFQTTGP